MSEADKIAESLQNSEELKKVEAPRLPKEVSLEPLENMAVDALLWREDAAKTKIALAKAELEHCKIMRSRLMNTLVQRLGIDTSKFTVSINQETKVATIIPK